MVAPRAAGWPISDEELTDINDLVRARSIQRLLQSAALCRCAVFKFGSCCSMRPGNADRLASATGCAPAQLHSAHLTLNMACAAGAL